MQDQEDDLNPNLISPRRRRKKKKKRRNLFDIPGVRKITLTELTQKIIECVVGEHVTSESPWKYVKKELVQDNLELHEESSEFLPLRREILAYPRSQILIGYIADETQDKDDEFYICVTGDATDTVQKIIEKLRQEQEDRLYYQLYKDIHPWQSMGTEEEVDESLVKNSRPLIEVEVETQYPIFPGKVQFRLLRAEKKRDGYMELRCLPEENLVNVYMRRIDSGVQVAPLVVSTEAQTICTYPKNSATQYLYDTGETSALMTQCEPEIIKYANQNFENLSDLLRVNGTINLYSNDFDSLVKNEALSNIADQFTATKQFTEYLAFMDVNLCKGKMISDIYWHEMWSGTIAIAYCDVSPNIFYNGPDKVDQVYKAVHTVNMVLIWSFLDALKPKLILETPREVQKLSFCKFDENILIGGCKNGQIIIWDIRNKLQKVEEKEVLTTAQQKYRNYMYSLMGWMKHSHDVAIVRPAAVSDLRYSHKAAITGISWVEPHMEFSRTGNLSNVESDEDGTPKYSMQLITSSLDGSVLIWDLKDKPIIHAGGYKPKRLRRLKKKPSALEVDVSPYRVLHLNLKPRYRINVAKKDNKNKSVAITRSSTGFCWVKYVEAYPEQIKKFDIKDRIIHKPVLIKPQPGDIKPQIKLGTAEGDFIELEWEGQDFDSGEIVNCEQGKYIYDSKYHDGPITTIYTSQTNKTTLTVGGKIFALWRNDFPGRPIVWRRSRHFYTKGVVIPFQEDFNKRNESYLLKLKQETEQKAKEEAAKDAGKEEPKAPERPGKKGPQPGKFMEWIAEQRQIKEEARIKAMIINKKQLDTKELEKRRKPLQKLDEENERKKRKQKERLKQGETIFRDTVASLFPDVMKEKPPPPPDPYAGGDSMEEKDNCYRQYEKLMIETDHFIVANPLQYDFSFKNLLVASKSKDEEYFHTHKHTQRFDDEKKLRKGEESLISSQEKSEGEPVGYEEEPMDNEDADLLEDVDADL